MRFQETGRPTKEPRAGEVLTWLHMEASVPFMGWAPLPALPSQFTLQHFQYSRKVRFPATIMVQEGRDWNLFCLMYESLTLGPSLLTVFAHQD